MHTHTDSKDLIHLPPTCPMGSTKMPSPWDQTPQEAWAENFRLQISAVTDNIQDSVDDYETGVQVAIEEGDFDTSVSADSFPVQKFSNAVDQFSDEAMRRATIVAAAEYLENNDVPGSVDTSGVAGNTEYNDTTDSQSDFENATEVLGYKFVSNWAESYE